MSSAPVAPNLAAAVNAAQTRQVPSGVVISSSQDLVSGTRYFHGMLYAETDSYKTSVAAAFGGPEHTLIINTRSPEQMISISDQDYAVARVQDGSSLLWAMQNPEKAADAAGRPGWKDDVDRVLVFDDFTEGAELLVDDNSSKDDGSEVKDGRKIYKATNSDIREALSSLKRKKMHLIFTALADVSLHPLANEETIYPKMPKGARAILTADLEYVFFIKRREKKFLCSTSYMSFPKRDEKTGKMIVGRREIFAKSKLPEKFWKGKMLPPGALGVDALGKAVLKVEEELDLKGLWDRVRTAK